MNEQHTVQVEPEDEPWNIKIPDKLCPFCGYERIALRRLTSVYAYAECLNCGTTVPGEDEEDAHRRWNTRVQA
jgi:Lar family restriction alleviation protein